MRPLPERIEIRTLRLSDSDPAHWAEALCEEERARAARYVRPEDRDRFRLGRGLLRTLLGAALGLAPAAVPLRANAFGKPVLGLPEGPAFNVAHSGDLVCVALGEARALGIDVERHRDDFDPQALGLHVLTEAEQRALARSDDPHRAFLRAFVLKEALLKGIGTGLLRDPRSVEITHGPDGRRIGPAEGEPDVWEGWIFGDLEGLPGYHGAWALLP
ncbi:MULTISPECIES: 4'-phosphopantetheinyl transferase family protein [unclassified Aureimonas]|uniref:4'-phosphopantetheinyl transferase family protein n=1 Tax=unclassified Aureimonas TaxID=2615206 RepID=UPI0006F6EB6B|nr:MULTISPECIES: 4'-phosphopantetheinyl transferase superfamily protein [unclassified Aureimonas]KQT68980.1 hypothetical protein ASG54_04805 [Aureimonas sp. Leaf460]KQT69211.1 hypothetical protein ASG62_17410 [Aureimonas sp. Leaf427]